jgi:hypothetical protein
MEWSGLGRTRSQRIGDRHLSQSRVCYRAKCKGGGGAIGPRRAGQGGRPRVQNGGCRVEEVHRGVDAARIGLFGALYRYAGHLVAYVVAYVQCQISRLVPSHYSRRPAPVLRVTDGAAGPGVLNELGGDTYANRQGLGTE